MAELQDKEGINVKRVFEQPPDAISLYAEMAQVMATKHEILLQFYETIPGPPDAEGVITGAISRLRATVVLSPAHARNVASALLQRLEETGQNRRD